MPTRKWILVCAITILSAGIIGAGIYVIKKPTQVLEEPEKEGAGKSTLPQIDTSDWITYQSTSMKFEMKYPPDWKVHEESPENPLSIDFSKDFPRDSYEISCNLNISLSPQESFEMLLKTHEYMKAEEWQQEEINLNGVPATKISYLKTPIVARYLLKRTEEVNYLIMHDVTQVKPAIKQHVFDAECMGIFDRILSTFRFTEELSLTPEIDTSDWETYRSQKYKYEIKYPNNWTAEEDKKCVTNDIAGSECVNIKNDEALVKIYPYKADQVSLKEFVNNFLGNYRGKLQKETERNGLATIIEIYHDDLTFMGEYDKHLGAIYYSVAIYFIAKGHFVFVIEELLSSGNYLKDYMQIFSQIPSTFRSLE